MTSRSGFRAAAVLVALAVLVGCGGPPRSPREAGSAVWVAPGSAPLLPEAARALRAAGAGEVFVEAVAIDEPTTPARQLELPSLPAGMRATLVASGPVVPGDPEAAADAIAAVVEEVAGRLESGRTLPVGLHVDLPIPADEEGGERLEELLSRLRRELDPRLALSISLAAEDLADPERLEPWLEATDFVVPFVYGQRPGEAERAETWRFERAEEAVRRLEAIEEPYLLGVVTVGSLIAVDANGGPIGATTEGEWAEVARSPVLRPSRGFALEGVDRQVLAFATERGWRGRGLQVPGGGTVRLVGTSGPHLAELKRRVDEVAGPAYRGWVAYRLPAVEEALSLSAGQIAAVLSGAPAISEPRVLVERLAGNGAAATYRFELENGNDEPSDLGLLDTNFAEVEIEGGWFEEVDPGHFPRYDLLAPGRDGRLAREVRRPTVVRLFVPLLGARERLTTGPVRVRRSGSAEPRLFLRASFLAPMGNEAVFGPVEWAESSAPEPGSEPAP